ncbi:MAG: TMEM165/GDT1 family protein [Atribacterota bacterium]
MPLIVIATAELGDKTQIFILLLSSKTNKHAQILIGVTLAFLIVDGIAIAAGSWITTIIPIKYLKIISGIAFIIFGILMLINKEESEKIKKFNYLLITSFFIIFLTEWGDKTQIAAALFATKYNPYMVLIGTILALFILSVIAILFGKTISEKMPRKTMNKIVTIIFIITGLSFFIL